MLDDVTVIGVYVHPDDLWVELQDRAHEEFQEVAGGFGLFRNGVLEEFYKKEWVAFVYRSDGTIKPAR